MTCSVCHRAVNVTDVDARGRCCFCDGGTGATETSRKRPDDASVKARASMLKARGALTDKRGNDEPTKEGA